MITITILITLEIRNLICENNNNPNNNDVNNNSLSDTSIECTNIRNTNDIQPLILDFTTSSQPNISDYSEPISESNYVPTKPHLNLSIDNNIESSSTHSTHQMITRSKEGIVKTNPQYAFLTNCDLDNDLKELSDALNSLV